MRDQPGLKQRLKQRLNRLLYEPRRDPIIVLGNHKSGTSAVASLLADCGQLTKSIDIPELWPRSQGLMHGTLDLAEIVAEFPKPFSRELIKEPNLTFFYPAVHRVFPAALYVFVNRDPRSNIRSFLSRCKLPGDLAELDPEAWDIPHSWRWDFDPLAWRSVHTHYIDLMAERWNRCADVYLEHPGEMLLLRYEDFLADKLGSIEKLAADCGLHDCQDISDKVDVQYQPRGTSRAPLQFFGAQNLLRIERLCGSRMREFGYELESPDPQQD